MEGTVNTKRLAEALRASIPSGTPRIGFEADGSAWVSSKRPDNDAQVHALEAKVKEPGWTHIVRAERLLAVLDLVPDQEARVHDEGYRLFLNGLLVSYEM
jgi:hypothetical protein